jgi:hypothetical protein
MAEIRARIRNRSRRRIAAASIATFLALLGYEAARMQAGGDPAFAHAKQKSSSRTTTRSQSSQSTTTNDSGSTGSDGSDGSRYGGYYGYYGDGQSGSGGGYYTPPASQSPSTGSS